MEPKDYLTRGLILPELNLLFTYQVNPATKLLRLIKQNKGAVCTRCASLSRSIYDKRIVTLRDAPIHGKRIHYRVTKHRYYCKSCKKPFTEPLPGVLPRRRTTQRFRKSIYWACENFSDLKKVEKAHGCSAGLVYKAYYEQLDLRERKHNRSPFPKEMGIDEHCFGRKKGVRRREFVTMIVDHKNKKLREVTLGKSHAELHESLSKIEGRENVEKITLDMSDSYKSFCKSFFPNAELIADRFHVQRLINPIMHQMRLEVTGDKRKNPVRNLLNRNRRNLKYFERSALDKWLETHQRIKAVYEFKESIARFYNIRGYRPASNVFNQILDRLGRSEIPELQSYRRTLMRWRKEILNFFKFRLTNARVEGFNNVAKVIKRRAYGFRSFKNYRLRLLNACN